VICHWLKVAGCKFIRPHVLRHTGIDRLVNKYRLPVPIMQAISQHANAQILLQVYGKPLQARGLQASEPTLSGWG
jgi:integrase